MTSFARPRPAIPPGLMRKFLLRTAVWLALIACVLFGAAGTLDWPGAWVYLGLSVVTSFAGGLWLARRDPGLLAERLGPIVQRDQKAWDKVFMIVVFSFWFAWLALMGLDIRYGWSSIPVLLQVAGFVLLGLGTYLIGLTFKANSFAAPVVKIQTEREHRVIDTGPYAHVRHPMYSGVLLVTAGAPLLLGSWWGLLAGALFVFLLAGRAVLEERTLKAELKGYADYAAKVRYRLVPYLW